MKRIKIVIVFLALIASFTACSCATRKVKENLSPETVAAGFENSGFSTWCHHIAEEDIATYQYTSELKIYGEDESRDYIFVYFFEDAESAEKYVKENNSKTAVVGCISVFFGEPTKAEFSRYDYMVVESYKSKTAKSRKEMLRILEDIVYSDD